MKPNNDVINALKVVLDCVDYTRPNCKQNQMVGAILPKQVIELARRAIKENIDAAIDRQKECDESSARRVENIGKKIGNSQRLSRSEAGQTLPSENQKES